jgi:hypothetical protein
MADRIAWFSKDQAIQFKALKDRLFVSGRATLMKRGKSKNSLLFSLFSGKSIPVCSRGAS